MLARLLPDRFLLWLLAAVALAFVAPVRGGLAAAADWATFAAIFALFFLHGARLPRAALIAGIADWRLHGAILGSTYLVFPLATLALAFAVPGLLTPALWTGMIFLSALPSTVQSSIAYTSMAGGNVAGAVAAAAMSNLVGVFLTPFLVSVMLEAQGASFSLGGIGRIFALIFLPFVLGHTARPLLRTLLERRPAITTTVDKGTILLAVYGAFSAAVVGDLWRLIPPSALLVLAGLCLVLLAVVLAAAWSIGRLGGFPPGSRDAILFCGSVKSLASGVPMARILFPGAAGGLVIVPVMLFHTLQLIVCAWIAASLARRRQP